MDRIQLAGKSGQFLEEGKEEEGKIKRAIGGGAGKSEIARVRGIFLSLADV